MQEVQAVTTIDLGSLSAKCRAVTPEAAARFAADQWGVTGVLRRFETEKDDTFRLDTPEGSAFVLKIANPAEPRDELDLQIAALDHIAHNAPDLPVPRVFPSREGPLAALETAEGVRLARLMSFLPGRVLDTLPPDRAEQYEIGRTAARLRLAMEGFGHPAAGRTIAWDVRRLPDLEPLIATVTDPGQRRRLETAFARFMDLLPRIEALPRQVLHNDFNRSNLVVDRSGPHPRIAGIIDFGDVVHTAIAIDVSTALLNQLPREDEPSDDMFAGPRAVLNGYLSEAPLSEEELSLIPHLVMGRLVTRALLSLWRAAQFPDNSRYILRNTAQGWAQLDWFLAQSPDEVSALLL